MNRQTTATAVILWAALTAGSLTAQTLFAPSGSVGTSLNGNVGIGTSSPGDKLHVFGGGIYLSDSNGSSTNRLKLSYNGMSGVAVIGPDSNGGHTYLSLGTAYSGTYAERVRIDNVGNVGIGTITPFSKVSVEQAGGNQILARYSSYGGRAGLYTGAYSGATFLGSNLTFSSGNVFNYDVTGLMWTLGSPGGQSFFGIATASGTAGTSAGTDTNANMRFVIDASGNIGIGTTAPASLLNISGNSDPKILLDGYGGGTGPILQGRFANGTQTSPSAATTDFSLIVLQGAGHNGSGFTTRRADISIRAAENWTSTANGTYMAFRNTPIGSQTPAEVVRITDVGNVGIGTTSPTYKLSVNGTIRAKEVIVDTGWSDYVFSKDYRLAPLSELEMRIKAEKHLPGIPTAREVADHGVSMGEMQSKLLAKVEELTLYVIDLKKDNTELRREVNALRAAAGKSP